MFVKTMLGLVCGTCIVLLCLLIPNNLRSKSFVRVIFSKRISIVTPVLGVVVSQVERKRERGAP